jgi:hypothetical protein
MADQTVKIEHDDIAAVTEELARSLWVEETGSSPKASDAAFFKLLSLCNRALRGFDDHQTIADFIQNKLPKRD